MMTRKEFIHRAAIQMAGKVIATHGIADENDWENVVAEADELATELEMQGYDFEEERP